MAGASRKRLSARGRDAGSDVIERVDAVLEKLLRKHRFGAIGLVAPEPLASVIRCRIQGGQLGDLWKATKGCGRVEVFEVQPQLPQGAAQASNPRASRNDANRQRRGSTLRHKTADENVTQPMTAKAK